jgi:hypothetical protein
MTVDTAVLPRMARPFWLGCEAWIASVGGLILVLTGTMVTHEMSTPVMATTLAVPPAMTAAIGVYEWSKARAYGDVLHPGHLLGIAVGLLLWLDYQGAPGSLPFDPSAAQLCAYVGKATVSNCLTQADTARLYSDIAWYSTGALIIVWALFAPYSRTAAWSSAVVALAGSAFALHFLEAFVRSYGM